MRDLLVTAIVLCSLPFIVKRPSIGIFMWVWLSLMNPHRLAFGFAHDLPFAAVVAGATFIGIAFTREHRRLPMTGLTTTVLLFMFWISLTSALPIHPGSGYEMWSRVMKILLMTLVAMAVVHKREHLQILVWIIVGSIGFYGVKGGLFTVLNGGSYLVWGPDGTFIGDNNSVALAFVMIIPLMRYLQVDLPRAWQRHAMTGAIVLCGLAAFGSHSRGALLAIAAMCVVLWWKSRNKAGVGIVLLAMGIGGLALMPDDWWARMGTITSYEEDASALGRINAWYMAWNLACDRVLGGGFEIYEPDVFARYAPNPLDIHAAHSIYFQVLGEHGFIGLALFLTLGFLTWRVASEAKRIAKKLPDGKWLVSLTDMIKVSMIGYAVGGAFLSLSYFDLPYYEMAILVVGREWAKSRAREVAGTRVPRGFGPRPTSVAEPGLSPLPVAGPLVSGARPIVKNGRPA